MTSEPVISEAVYRELLQTLRNFKRPRESGKSKWIASCLVSERLEEKPGLSPYEAFEQILTETLEALRAKNPQHADILRLRFWDGVKIDQLLEPGPLWSSPEEIPQERTFLDIQKRAVKDFAFILLQKEEACRQSRLTRKSEGSGEKASSIHEELPASSTQPLGRFFNKWLVASVLLIVAVALLLAVLGRANGLWGTAPKPAITPTTTSIPILTPTLSPTPTQTPTSTPMGNVSLCGETERVPDTPLGDRFLRDQGVTSFTKENTPGGPSGDCIRSLAADANGVWVGYCGYNGMPGGISYLNRSVAPKIWADCSKSGLAQGQHVNDIKVDRTGKVWVATDGGGVLAFDGASWQIFTIANSRLPDNRIFGLAIDKDNNIWAGTWEGVAKFDGVRWDTKYTAARELANNRVHAIAFDSAGDIWVGYISEGVSQFRSSDSKWVLHQAGPEGIGGNEIRNIVVRPAQNGQPESVWFATEDGGVSKFEQGKWTVYGLENGLPSLNTQTIAIDAYGRVWVATDGGVAYFDEQTWIPYTTLSTYAIAFKPDCPDSSLPCDDDVWTGTRQSGLTHSRLPYPSQAIDVVEVCFVPLGKERTCQSLAGIEYTRIITVTYPKKLEPGDQFQFDITVKPRALYKLDGQRDFLANTAKNDANLFGAHVQIGVKGVIDSGQLFTFADYGKPLQAPQLANGEQERTFFSTWRVWMRTRYAGPYIRIAFTVHSP